MAGDEEGPHLDKRKVDNAPSVIFLHLPKTGGETFRSILERHFRLQPSFHRYNSWEKPDLLAKLPLKSRARLRLVYGHMGFGWHQYLPQSCIYITIIRNPIQRVISEYYFLLERPDQELHRRVVKSGSLENYIHEDIHHGSTNLQTRWIAGEEFLTARTSDRSVLRRAEYNLDKHFAWVGITERFDESLIALKSTLHWQSIYYARANVTKRRPRLEEIPERVLREIEERNELDMELYEHVTKRFDQETARNFPFLGIQVAQFRVRNRRYGRMLSGVLDFQPRVQRAIIDHELRKAVGLQGRRDLVDLVRRYAGV